MKLSCDQCGATGESLKQCARCKMVRYCSKECQVSAWKKHKKECGKKKEPLAVKSKRPGDRETPRERDAALAALKDPTPQVSFPSKYVPAEVSYQRNKGEDGEWYDKTETAVEWDHTKATGLKDLPDLPDTFAARDPEATVHVIWHPEWSPDRAGISSEKVKYWEYMEHHPKEIWDAIKDHDVVLLNPGEYTMPFLGLGDPNDRFRTTKSLEIMGVNGPREHIVITNDVHLTEVLCLTSEKCKASFRLAHLKIEQNFETDDDFVCHAVSVVAPKRASAEHLVYMEMDNVEVDACKNGVRVEVGVRALITRSSIHCSETFGIYVGHRASLSLGDSIVWDNGRGDEAAQEGKRKGEPNSLKGEHPGILVCPSSTLSLCRCQIRENEGHGVQWAHHVVPTAGGDPRHYHHGGSASLQEEIDLLTETVNVLGLNQAVVDHRVAHMRREQLFRGCKGIWEATDCVLEDNRLCVGEGGGCAGQDGGGVVPCPYHKEDTEIGALLAAQKKKQLEEAKRARQHTKEWSMAQKREVMNKATASTGFSVPKGK